MVYESVDRLIPYSPSRTYFSFFFFSSRRRHTRCSRDWSSDVCSSDLAAIDRDLKPQSRPLPDTQATLHYRNVSVSTGKSYNVAGLLEGSDPQLKAETIIFSGHHDHDGISGDQIWHGADDNGSGTVGVVALAQAFAANAAHGEKPKRSLLFVVFAAEERGLLGSFYIDRKSTRLNSSHGYISYAV